MIIGTLDNWQQHFSGPVWEEAFEFLKSLDAESPEGFTKLRGDDLYGRVMSYDTISNTEAKLESHHNYIDIQTSIVGGEGIDWYYRPDIEDIAPYNSEKDVINHIRPEGPAPVHIRNYPGVFSVFFPEDAHMPKLEVGTGHVKKAVAKIHIKLLG